MARNVVYFEQNYTFPNVKLTLIWAETMQDYEFRFLDRTKVTVHVEVHPHRDDISALDRACDLSRTHHIEIWNDDHFVARIKKGNAALTERDRVSL